MPSSDELLDELADYCNGVTITIVLKPWQVDELGELFDELGRIGIDADKINIQGAKVC